MFHQGTWLTNPCSQIAVLLPSLQRGTIECALWCGLWFLSPQHHYKVWTISLCEVELWTFPVSGLRARPLLLCSYLTKPRDLFAYPSHFYRRRWRVRFSWPMFFEVRSPPPMSSASATCNLDFQPKWSRVCSSSTPCMPQVRLLSRLQPFLEYCFPSQVACRGFSSLQSQAFIFW